MVLYELNSDAEGEKLTVKERMDVTNLVHLGFALISDINDVYPAGVEGGHHQFVPDTAGVAVARGASVPSHVMQLVSHVWHGKAVDYLSVLS